MGAVRPSPRNPATAMTPSSAADPLPDPWQAARDGACHAPLAGLAFIDVEGADAATFLNGQLSNDVTSLQPGAAQWTSYNSPKGRMLANPLLWRPAAGPAYRLALPADVAAAVRKRLQMFVLRSKVVLKDPDALTAIGVGGPGAAAAVAGVLGRPPAVMRVTEATTGGAAAIGLADGRVLVIVPAGEAGDSGARRSAVAPPAPETVWRWLAIRAGVAQIVAPAQDRHVAQTANWEVVGGVSFTKGCYTGQEIIARAQHLGIVKERAHPFHAPAPAPAPATPLYSPPFGDQACGSVLDAVDVPEGGSDLLAVAQLAAVESGDIRLGAPDGPRLVRLPLPYTLPASAPRRVKL